MKPQDKTLVKKLAVVLVIKLVVLVDLSRRQFAATAMYHFIFMPLIVLYTSWAYRVMRGKVNAAYIRENEHGAY